LTSKQISGLEEAISKDLPGLMHQYPMTLAINFITKVNPFSGEQIEKVPIAGDNYLSYSNIDQERYRNIWISLRPKGDRIPGVIARQLFKASGLNTQQLGNIWKLADLDCDGELGFEEFCLAMHLIDSARRGGEIPAELPKTLLAPT
jgi:hypothetical protein